MNNRRRLDLALVDRALAPTREKARALILAGDVTVDGHPEARAGAKVTPESRIEVAQPARFVGRGGEKLDHALNVFSIDVAGAVAMDVGASTGGFTDCLLQRGAAHVVALDVAYGELDWRIRRDSRVTVLERTNVRGLRPEQLPYAPELIVVDVSFIGLDKVLPAFAACAGDRFDLLALVKPQFEVGRERVGKGGVVRDASDRLDALVSAGHTAAALGLGVQGFASSGLPGPAGNRETFIWCAEATRDAVGDLEAAALEAEPEAAGAGTR